MPCHTQKCAGQMQPLAAEPWPGHAGGGVHWSRFAQEGPTIGCGLIGFQRWRKLIKQTVALWWHKAHKTHDSSSYHLCGLEFNLEYFHIVGQCSLVPLCRAEIIIKKSKHWGDLLGNRASTSPVGDADMPSPNCLCGVLILEGLRVRGVHAEVRICCDLPE